MLARIVEPQTSHRGDKLAREGVRDLAASHIRNTLSIAAVMTQFYALLGILDGMGPGVVLPAERRRKVLHQEILWTR